MQVKMLPKSHRLNPPAISLERAECDSASIGNAAAPLQEKCDGFAPRTAASTISGSGSARRQRYFASAPSYPPSLLKPAALLNVLASLSNRQTSTKPLFHEELRPAGRPP